ncbi:RNA-binding domain-containing protein [Crassaminicella profunda]|uniref:RNA-binding domain-containing protein n=1 Tax=Crassaminicella profunda TaxID=1286698 RepID=UPI001CA6B6B1|nr:RNA-binding domain-containing protein [Crassaminicella profunda]QZY57217.1 putative DNA binding domain-containing protein [Crassaminicella profunda]
MNFQKLKILIKQKEGMKLDFKESLHLNTHTEKKEFAKDVMAIANSIGGRGYLIIGVKDKEKKIKGIDPEDFQEERLQQIISHRCDPPVNIRVECIKYNEKYVGVITIFKSPQRPHQMRQTGAFYIRRGSTTDIARRDEIAGMFQEAGLINNELIPLYNLDVSVLNKGLISQYLKKMGIFSNEKMMMGIWNNLGIVHFDSERNRYCPTIGGFLLFCNTPGRYLPYVSVKIITFQKDRKRIHVIEGNMLKMLNECGAFISEYLKSTDYPKEAIFECIANAVVHRDYMDILREIVVIIGDHKVEISNPGTLPKGSNIHTIMRENNPSRRNNWLYHRLLFIDDQNQFLRTGIGLQKISKMFENVGNVKFLNIEKRNLFKVVMPGLKKFSRKDKN